jgi:hypothetical protein
VGQASGGRSDGNGHLTRRKWLFSGNGNNVGTIDRNFYIGNVLQKLHINRYKIIALQCSRPRKFSRRVNLCQKSPESRILPCPKEKECTRYAPPPPF